MIGDGFPVLWQESTNGLSRPSARGPASMIPLAVSGCGIVVAISSIVVAMSIGGARNAVAAIAELTTIMNDPPADYGGESKS